MKKKRQVSRVVLGTVSGVYGVRGWVRVISYTDPIDGMLDYRNCLVGDGEDWQQRQVAESRRHGKGLVLRFEGVDDRDTAAGLVGKQIAVHRNQLPETERGSYYWADLVGLDVNDRDGHCLGQVDHLLPTGANDVLVVRGEKEILIPFLYGTVIEQVDLEAGVIRVDWDWDWG